MLLLHFKAGGSCASEMGQFLLLVSNNLVQANDSRIFLFVLPQL